MYSLFMDIFTAIIIFNVAALTIWMVFLINARVNLKRQIAYKRFLIRLIQAALKLTSSEEASAALNITVEEFKAQCGKRYVDTPEIRKEKEDLIKNRKREEEQRIIAEEEQWHEEQNRIVNERRTALEEDTKRRMERLKKFGFK